LQEPDIWNNPERAQALGKERAQLEAVVDRLESLDRGLNEVAELLILAGEEGDEAAVVEVVRDLETHGRIVADLEFQRMFSGELDPNNAFVDIHSGAGGTESQDWAEMLLRMYLRWAEKNGYSSRIIDISSDEEAGIKHATVEISGQWAFGYLKGETGVHRLVRISPFDANKRRHTSFAAVLATPEVDQNIDINIDDKDLRIDTYRASGHGGQHVNKTDSAVRITHLPTNTVVQCQNERSQHKNKAFAMKLLASKLYELEELKQKDRMNEFSKGKKEITWGSQIRSYVLQPYQLVKDHRTGTEMGNVDSVLDGDITAFIDAYLSMMATARGGEGAGSH